MNSIMNVFGQTHFSFSAKQSTTESDGVRKMTESVSIELRCFESQLSIDLLQVKEL